MSLNEDFIGQNLEKQSWFEAKIVVNMIRYHKCRLQLVT